MSKINKYIIIDNRMRNIEKEFLTSLGYELIELPTSNQVYPEISLHVDIFCTKINNIIIVEKSQYDYIKSKINTDILRRRKFCRKGLSR